MVSTRNHPQTFTEPTSPSATSPSPSSRTESASPKPTSPSTAVATRRATSASWAHTPSNLTLIWMAVSLPLVIWDTIYMLGRPYTLPGGPIHAPIWSPYELYGRVDKIYGVEAWDKRDGFGPAQGTLNAFETAGYLVYLYLVYSYGREIPAAKGRGAPRKATQGGKGWLQRLAQPRSVAGTEGAQAVLLLFATAACTLSKTVLYWLQEYFNGYAHIGHNDALSLFFLWIIPNGAWLVGPTYLLYIANQEIVQGLSIAGGSKKTA